MVRECSFSQPDKLQAEKQQPENRKRRMHEMRKTQVRKGDDTTRQKAKAGNNRNNNQPLIARD
ncbi:hypothetical protein GCM10008940_32030 [Microbulbifer agarilyticus]